MKNVIFRALRFGIGCFSCLETTVSLRKAIKNFLVLGTVHCYIPESPKLTFCPPLSLFLFLTKCFASFFSTSEIPYTCVT